MEETNKMGRPIKWDYNTVMITMQKMLDLLTKGKEEKGIVDSSPIFSIKEICLELGFSSQRYHEWCELYSGDPDFSESSNKIKEICELRILSHGRNAKNATIDKLMLTNNYGYEDNKKVTTSQKVEYERVVKERHE